MEPDPKPLAESQPPTKGSTPVPGPSDQQRHSIEFNNENAPERVEFERVLADIASRLSNATDEQFDEVLTGCLRTLVEFLGFDRSTLMAFSEHGSRFQMTHSWAAQGVPVVPSDAPLNTQAPWFTHQIRSGHIVNVSSPVDLPSVAAKERVYALKNGIKSLLAIPLLMEGTIVGALTLASLGVQRRWPIGLVSRLRLAGEILALV